jgi:hypothetical protein
VIPCHLDLKSYSAWCFVSSSSVTDEVGRTLQGGKWNSNISHQFYYYQHHHGHLCWLSLCCIRGIVGGTYEEAVCKFAQNDSSLAAKPSLGFRAHIPNHWIIYPILG